MLSPLGKEHGHSFEETWIPFTQRCILPSLVEIGSVVLENVFKFHQCIFLYFVIISLLKNVGPFIWTILNPLHTRMHCAKFGEIGPVVLEEKIIKFSQCIFAISLLSPLLDKCGALHLENLSPHHQRMLCARLVEIGLVVLKKIF